MFISKYRIKDCQKINNSDEIYQVLFQVEFQVWYHSDHIYIKEQMVGENGTKNIQRKF
jgi:hypothetical protein